jgi:hypothetical protein
MKRKGVDVSFNHIHLSIATQTWTMTEQLQGLGGAPTMSGASSAHHPVVEKDDGNKLEEAHIDLESAFSNSHESRESSSNNKTPSENADGSKCEKILELNQNSLKLLLVMAVGYVKNNDSIANTEAKPYKSAHEKNGFFQQMINSRMSLFDEQNYLN